MNIKTINQAKKYLNKPIYTAHDFKKRDAYKVATLYIGGVYLFYNQVDYDVIGFELYENKACTEGWGEVKKERIKDKFEPSDRWHDGYFTSRTEAEKYCEWLKRDSVARDKEHDLETAKELLGKHSIKFEIFE